MAINSPDWFKRLVAKSSGRNLGEFRMLDEFYKETSTIKHDRFDEKQFEAIRDKAKELSSLSNSRFVEDESWPDVVKDDYLALYKAVPEQRTPNEIKPTHRVNHAAISKMMDTKEYEELRTYTELDEWAAAMGAVASGKVLGEFFDEAKDLMAQQDKVREKDKNVQDAMDELKDMQEDGSDEEVEQALDDLKNQLDDYGDAVDSMDEAIDGAQASLRSAGRQAAKAGNQEAQDIEAAVRTFGTDPGTLSRMPASARMELAQRIARSQKLRDLANLAGRLKRFAWGQQASKISHGVDEIHDIQIGDDINRVLPSELALLASKDTEMLFYAKYIEKRLMQYELRGTEKVAKGAIICLIDNSGSMTGSREMWAKAVGLALLDVAHKQKRDFYGIHFSSNYDALQEFWFPKGDTSDLNKVLDFAEYFYGGGTDYELPLSRAVEVLEMQMNDEDTQKGDIILLTDGECYVSDEWLARFNNSREEIGFRLFSCLIGGHGRLLREISDVYLTIQDLTSGEDAKEVFGYV